MSALIEARHLKKYFKSAKGTVHAVDDVSMKIEAGRTMGVVGESGCGKSTLGRTLIHLLESTDGELLFEGKDVTHVTPAELKKLREKTGTTQRQLAEAIGVSQQSVNKYENHNIEPDIETLVRIADYFAVSVDAVIGHAEDDGELTESERLLLQKYRRLTPKRRAAVDALLDCF